MTPKVISSRANPAYKALRGMAVGFGENRILVEGEKLICEALQAGLSPEAAWSHGPWPITLNCPRFEVSRDMYTRASPTRSGQAPLAVFTAPQIKPLGDSWPTEGRYLLLDRLQDPGNAGALVRAAAAFGLTGILWLKPCVYPFHHAAVRASAGTVFKIAHYLVEALPNRKGLPLIGAAGEADAVPLAQFTWPQHLILAMGHEGGGLSDDLRAHLAHTVSIPMAPGVESLNVSGAAHILMYQLSQTI